MAVWQQDISSIRLQTNCSIHIHDLKKKNPPGVSGTDMLTSIKAQLPLAHEKEEKEKKNVHPCQSDYLCLSVTHTRRLSQTVVQCMLSVCRLQ